MIELQRYRYDKMRDENTRSMGRYIMKRFTEDANPAGARLAQEIQAESYRASGYVQESAVVDGRLKPEIDLSRGDDVLYYIGEDREDRAKRASLRRKFMSLEGGLDSLSAFKDSKDFLYEGVKEELQKNIEQYGQRSVAEICALGKTSQAPSALSVRLMGAAINDVYENNPNEKWLILFTNPAYRSIRHFFGPSIIRQAGEEVATVGGSKFVSSDLRFTPVIADPSSVYDILADEIQSGKLDRRDHLSRIRTLRLITENISTKGMKESTAKVIKDLQAGKKAS